MDHRAKLTDESSRKFLRVAICLLLVALSFPPLFPDYGSGLDASYRWALNYLFHEQYNDLLSISYPYGPLAILSIPSPVGNNLVYYFLFYFIVRFIFLLLLFRRCEENLTRNLFIVTLLTFSIGYFTTEIDIVLIGVVTLSTLRSEELQNQRFLLLASIAAALAIYIKSSIGISCLSVIGTSFFITWIKKRRTAELMKQSFLSFAAFFLISILVLRDPLQPFVYLSSVLELSGGYAESMALFPENDWSALTLFLLSYFLLFFFLSGKQRKVFALLFLPFFAFWKHSMVREDPSHNALMMYFLLLALPLYLVSGKFRISTLLLSISTVVFFYQNFKQLPSAEAYNFHYGRLNAFGKQIVNYSSFFNRFEKTSVESVREDTLNRELQLKLKGKLTDVYPWELAYVPANNLFWRPRPTLELGASTSPVAVVKNAGYYSFENLYRPDVILLHLTTDASGGHTTTLDGRYLLNDEPDVISALLDGYQFSRKEDNMLVYERSKQKALGEALLLKEESIPFNQWIAVPAHLGLLKAQTSIFPNLKGKMLKAIYKDQPYFIDYLLQDSSIVSYRFIPSLATMGLWVSPFIRNFTSTYADPDAVKLRFRCDQLILVNNEIKIQWMQTLTVDEKKSVNELFGKTNERGDTVLYSFLNTFQDFPPNGFSTDQRIMGDDGSKFNLIPEQGYSSVFSLKTDSIWEKGFQSVDIFSSVRYKGEHNVGTFVIQIDGGKKPYWSGKKLDCKDDGWKTENTSVTISKANYNSSEVKIYIWNNSNKGSVFADDFTVRMVAHK